MTLKARAVSMILAFILMFSGCYADMPQQQAAATAPASDRLRLYFIDVGQADSILILLPNAQTMLIDAGNNKDGDMVVDFLKSKSVSKIDYLVGTHPHEDHIGGLDTVINTFDIGKIYMPKVSNDTKTFKDVLSAIDKKGLRVDTAKAGVNILTAESLSIDILAPNKDKYEELNNYSAVLKLTYRENSFLLMGDAEKLSEKEIMAVSGMDVSADLIKVGHHGSNTSSGEEFLKRVNPQNAIIMVGEGNTYHHPAIAALNMLSSLNIHVYRTDNDGTILAESDGKTINISVHVK